MKKKNILNLIRYHTEKNDAGFRSEAYEIANYFDTIGDYELSQYLMALLSEANTFSPQISEESGTFFQKLETINTSLPLPESIKENIIGIVNAVGHNAGINKFLFEGPPGTGKTESVKQIARILDRELYIVEFSNIIDSKLGQTSKNLSILFDEMARLANPKKAIILFDEIDAIAIDRINSNDLREMGRATSAILKGFDNVNDDIVIIATTNLFNAFDKALVRRFDSIIDFSQYNNSDLIEISEIMLSEQLNKFKFAGRNIRLFKKIIGLMDPIPYPGELKNLIKTSIAFSDSGKEFDYLIRLFKTIMKDTPENALKELQESGFTVRELEILTGVSKSKIAREIKEITENE